MPTTKHVILYCLIIGILILIVITLLIRSYQIEQAEKLRITELEKLTAMAMSMEKQNIKLTKHHGVYCLIYDKSGNIFIQRKGKLIKVGSIEKIQIKGKD